MPCRIWLVKFLRPILHSRLFLLEEGIHRVKCNQRYNIIKHFSWGRLAYRHVPYNQLYVQITPFQLLLHQSFSSVTVSLYQIPQKLQSFTSFSNWYSWITCIFYVFQTVSTNLQKQEQSYLLSVGQVQHTSKGRRKLLFFNKWIQFFVNIKYFKESKDSLILKRLKYEKYFPIYSKFEEFLCAFFPSQSLLIYLNSPFTLD